MSTAHASFDRWWNGISLRAKITGVTVLLLTLGLVVAGVGTMTVLRTYLLEQEDRKVVSLYNSAYDLHNSTQEFERQSFASCSVRYSPNESLFMILNARGEPVCENVPDDRSSPDTTAMTLSWTLANQGSPVTISDAESRTRWRVIVDFVEVDDARDYYTLVVGVGLTDMDAIVNRYAVIFFGFAIAVIVLGAATTQLLVTSTFSPLRDVEATAARFAAGDYSQRLGGATPNTEVGRLNRSLNTMLARIDRAFADRQRTVDQMRRFVGDASHELRTPLVSLRGYAELYRMGALQKPEDVAQAMDRIEREAIRMSALVEDLLELARLDEAKPLELGAVDLLPIAQDAALDASASAPAREVRVVVREPVEAAPADEHERAATAGEDAADRAGAAGTVDAATPRPTTTRDATDDTASRETGSGGSSTGPIAFAGATLARLRRRRQRGGKEAPVPQTVVPLPEVGPVVLGNENKLRQVVTNLIGNAMRFTPDDSPIELVVGVDRIGGYGQLAIVDHGEGIPPQLREKIFQRFWRADTSRTRDTGGSGLGLAIVAGIVANHEGHVEVFETPGGGSTFQVSIPLLPRTAEPRPSTDPGETPPAEPPLS